jgi:hypothetical protein
MAIRATDPNGVKDRIPARLRREVLHRDSHQCRYCGVTGVPFEMDHVMAEIHGGPTSYENLATACMPCNRRKGDKWGVFPYPVGYFDQRLPWWRQRSTRAFINLGVLAVMVDLAIFAALWTWAYLPAATRLADPYLEGAGYGLAILATLILALLVQRIVWRPKTRRRRK